MASSLLGKRARAGPTESPESSRGISPQRLDCHCLCSQTTSESSAFASRVKRRATRSVVNDENVDPKAAQNGYHSTPYDDGIQLDAPEDPFFPSQCVEAVAKATQCIAGKDWLALSPHQISSHFKIIKAVTSMSILLRNMV